MPRIKTLTEKARKYCQLVAQGKPRGEAAQLAGYDKSAVQSPYWQIEKNDPFLQKYLAELRQEAHEKCTLSLTDRIRMLEEMAEDPTSGKQIRMKALDLIAKMTGDLKQNINITGIDPVVILPPKNDSKTDN